jgi:hypothetical protein
VGFVILAVIACGAAALLIRRNRERAASAPLRGEIEAQVRYGTTVGRACHLGRSGFGGAPGTWYDLRGPKRLTVGTDAFTVSAPQALREYVFNGRESAIGLTQMRFGPAGRDWIVIKGQANGREVQLAIMPDDLADTWNALAGAGAALMP